MSIMRLDQGLDTGPVFRTVRTPIGEDETAGTLTERLITLGIPAAAGRPRAPGRARTDTPGRRGDLRRQAHRRRVPPRPDAARRRAGPRRARREPPAGRVAATSTASGSRSSPRTPRPGAAAPHRPRSSGRARPSAPRTAGSSSTPSRRGQTADGGRRVARRVPAARRSTCPSRDERPGGRPRVAGARRGRRVLEPRAPRGAAPHRPLGPGTGRSPPTSSTGRCAPSAASTRASRRTAAGHSSRLDARRGPRCASARTSSMRGVAPHAAVGETVAVAPARARGYVNGVLRALAASGPPWPDAGRPTARRSPTRTGCVARLDADLGADDARAHARPCRTRRRPSRCARTRARTNADGLDAELRAAGAT